MSSLKTQRVEPKPGLFYPVINFNWIVCWLCTGNKEHSEHLYFRAAIFVRPLCEFIMTGQCLWKFLTSRLWLFRSKCHASVKTQIWLIPSVSLKSEVETVSAVAVCTDRMHISIPGIVALFWRLGLCRVRPPAEGVKVLCKTGQEDDAKLRRISNQLYYHSLWCIFSCPLINWSKLWHYPAIVFRFSAKTRTYTRLLLVLAWNHLKLH